MAEVMTQDVMLTKLQEQLTEWVQGDTTHILRIHFDGKFYVIFYHPEEVAVTSYKVGDGTMVEYEEAVTETLVFTDTSNKVDAIVDEFKKQAGLV